MTMNPALHLMVSTLLMVQAMLIAVFLYGLIFERGTSND